MREALYVFDKLGRVMYWHLPQNRGGGGIPDSRALWVFMWENREEVGGFAHSHPWDGPAWCSDTDVRTFAAYESGLGKRLNWVVATFTDVGLFRWEGPGKHDYVLSPRRFRVEGVEKLRELSRVD